MKNYKGKKILILGAARSGLSACRLLCREGADVTVYDRKEADRLDIPGDLNGPARFITGSGGEDIDAAAYDAVVTSPGFAPDSPLMKSALKKGVRVISELQVGLEFLPRSTIVAVTGTNGKTTTCSLIQYLTGGKVAGNIGIPLTSETGRIEEGDTVILEVSSFQIPFSPGLAPDVSVLLNIFPEHIEWHGDFGKYWKAKKEMFLRQGPEKQAVINDSVRDIPGFMEGLRHKTVLFSPDRRLDRGVMSSEGGDIIYIGDSGKKEILMEGGRNPLPGAHNMENLMAALAVCRILGIRKIKDLSGFALPPHRLERVAVKNGITYIDDSKATNMHSTLKALQSMEKPVILLMGGRTKGQMHPDLRETVRRKVKKIVAFGESRKEITGHFAGAAEITQAEGLREAVAMASASAAKGDTVLLSPGGSSFDEFTDYKDRGDKFRKWVEEL
ncbi:MAG: UDP-N-acetylmuramoyl-L-alanine--D-glutamate ligase [Elusimicrobia bacterium]|nr:UDP-N-acetylmuramoyl-L-alanine--D-glutamate ligase [Elusimicrobiota bacterium]